jgi:hypothetical protein
MGSAEVLKLSEEGRRRIKSVALTELEAKVLIGATKKTLKHELVKNTKLTRAVLADTLVKLLPLCDNLFDKKSFSSTEVAPDITKVAQEVIEKYNETSILAAVVEKTTEKTTNIDSSDHSKDAASSNKAVDTKDNQEKPICRFFLVGRCRYEKSGATKCPYTHPKICKAFDKHGPDACKEKECPQGLHRKICEKLVKNGDCRRKKCGFYHPVQLRKKSRAKMKDENEDKSRWQETLMDGFKNFSFSPQIMQFPTFPVIAVMAIPPPPTSKWGKKG